MMQQTINRKNGRSGAAFLAVLGLLAAFGSATMARADDPPKKNDGKVRFAIGPVTHTPDKKPTPTPAPKKPDPAKGKQPPPKGN